MRACSGDAAPFLQGVGQASWRRACWYYCIAVAATLGYILGLLAELLLKYFYAPVPVLPPAHVPSRACRARAHAHAPPPSARSPFTFFDRGSKQRRHLDTQQPLPGAKHGFLRANGIKLHAVSLTRQPDNAGSDKPLLLFLHGFPEFWYSWYGGHAVCRAHSTARAHQCDRRVSRRSMLARSCCAARRRHLLKHFSADYDAVAIDMR